ncbi:MAG TPA: dipeptide/oligopeptide/nickel ABC transporter permease/ATP-binding protein [Bradyrhizobium sp.]|nr:dipeptide/oligopeptide/nickel ABC transporter permease/ATP-binding protein [Bradyrhizobium sp.]
MSARKTDDDRHRQHSSASVASHSSHRSGIGLWSRLNRFDQAVLVVFVLILIIAAIGPFVTPYPPTVADPLQRLVSPNGAHPFGTDENGIDVLSRLIAAPRTDVLIAVIATTLSVAIGAPLGVVAGYFEGADRRAMRWISEATLRLLDVVQAFPVFILAMVLVAIYGTGPVNVVLAVAFVNFPVFLRLVRSEILSLRERLYAEAAVALGNSELGVGFKHLLPNAWPTVLVQVSVTIGFAVLLTAGLSFVGAGVSPPTPELGAMIASGAKFMIIGKWWVAMFPGLLLGIIVFTFAAMGDIVGKLMEPEQRAPRSRHFLSEDRIAPLAQAPAPPAQGAVLSVRGLAIEASGGPPILDGVSFDLMPGEILGVVGLPGSGKSILVRAILRLLGQDLQRRAGQVFFRGKDLADLDEKALRAIRGCEILPLLPNAKSQLNPLVRIGDLMVAHIRAHYRCSRREAHARAAMMLRAIGIGDAEHWLAAYPHELSGGMAQRVCLAIALVHRPPLIVADEPTAGLDVTVQRQVLDLMTELCHQSGAAQVLATRELGIVAHYCNRVAVLHEGLIVEMGSVRDVLLAPRHAVTRRLIAAADLRAVSAAQTPTHPRGSSHD